ncbi:hypothetical protein BH11CYA1_BH11CYA1_47710 [soil metagenome]
MRFALYLFALGYLCMTTLILAPQSAHCEVLIKNETAKNVAKQTRIYPYSELFIGKTAVDRWASFAKYAPLILSMTEGKLIKVFGGSSSQSESPELTANTRHYTYVLEERYDEHGTPTATILDISVNVRGGKVSSYKVEERCYLTF